MKQQRIIDYFDKNNQNELHQNVTLDDYKISCPHCGMDVKIKKSKRKRKYKDEATIYFCKNCRKKFTDDPISGSHYPLWVWDRILDLHVKGMNAKAITQDIIKIAKIKEVDLSISKSTVLNIIVRSNEILAGFEEKMHHDIISDVWQIDDCFQRLTQHVVKQLTKQPSIKVYGYVTNVLAIDTKFWLSAHVSTNRKDEHASLEAIRSAVSRSKYHPQEVRCDGNQINVNTVKKILPRAIITSKSKDIDYAWINYVERLNETMRSEALPKHRRFNSIELLRASAEISRLHYNYLRGHTSLNGKTPAFAVGIKFPFRDWCDIFNFAYRIKNRKQ